MQLYTFNSQPRGNLKAFSSLCGFGGERLVVRQRAKSSMASNQGRVGASPPQSNEPSDAQVRLSQLFDPYKYSLKHVHIRSELARLPLGMKTEVRSRGVVLVTELKKGGIADAHGVELESYLLCANGRQCTGEADDLKTNGHGIRMTIARKRKSQLSPEVPFAFLGRHQRQLGCDYLIARVNLITCKLPALHLVKGKGERVCLGLSSDRTAIDAFGLRVGDVIVAVDYVHVRDKGHCEALLRAAQNDIIDLTIERPQMVSIPVINVKASDASAEQEFSLSSDDDGGGFGGGGLIQFEESEEPGLGLEEEIGGDPSMGVPQHIPSDVNRILKGGGLELAKKIIGAKKSSGPARPIGVNRAAIAMDQPLAFTSGSDERVVKIAKGVDTAKLKKGPTTPPKPPPPKKKKK